MTDFAATKSIPPMSGAMVAATCLGGVLGTSICAMFIGETAAIAVGLGTAAAVVFGLVVVSRSARRTVTITVSGDLLTIGAENHPVRDIAFGPWHHGTLGRMGTIVALAGGPRAVRIATPTAVPDACYSLRASHRHDYMVGDVSFVESLAPGVLVSGTYTIDLHPNRLRSLPNVFATGPRLQLDAHGVAVWRDGSRIASAPWRHIGVVRTHYHFSSRFVSTQVPVVTLSIPGMPEPLSVAGQALADESWQEGAAIGPVPRLQVGPSDWQTLMRHIAGT